MASSHRVIDLVNIPVQISKDEALMPLSIVGPLFISSSLLHLSQTLLGAWCFSLFHSVYSSFHNRLDLIREPAFYWVFCFIFPVYLCFIICLFHSVYSSFHNRLDLIREPAFYWVFYFIFPVYLYLFHHM